MFLFLYIIAWNIANNRGHTNKHVLSLSSALDSRAGKVGKTGVIAKSLFIYFIYLLNVISPNFSKNLLFVENCFLIYCSDTNELYTLVYKLSF